MIAAVCTFLALLAVPTLQQNQNTPASPCPNVFKYEPSGSEPGKWYGVIFVSTDITLYGLWLNIVLDNKADILGNWVGDVTTKDNLNFKIENTTMRIRPGSGLTVRFFIQYKSSNTTPRLYAIRLNGKEICNFNAVQTVTNKPPRQETVGVQPFTGSRPVEKVEKPVSVQPVNSEPVKDSTHSSIIDASSGGQKVTENKYADGECGKVSMTPKVLANGTSLEGQWPWQGALYFQGLYKGGATLISNRHVVTGAYCVTSDNKPLDHKFMTVYLGGHNIKTSTEGVQIQFVEKMTIHPNNSKGNFNNLVILQLEEPVKISNWVRPICLWPNEEVDIKNIIGKKGTVVEWSFNTRNVAADELCVSEMPVVDLKTCIRSNTAFFLKYTSYNNYCTGNIDRSDCKHVSGSGMFFKMSDTWYIRGVFASCYAPVNLCELNHYNVYTDVAKYLPWIRETMADLTVKD